MAISKRLRYEILRRDAFACRYCGGKAPHVVLTVDHVVPKAIGGTDDPTNLVACCQPCNAGKASTTPDAVSVAEVIAEDMDWARRVKASLSAMEEIDAVVDTFDRAWKKFSYYCSSCDAKHWVGRPSRWQQSVKSMARAGLTASAVEHAVTVAMSRSNVEHDEVFRYFCGVAWSTLRDAQELAAREGRA